MAPDEIGRELKASELKRGEVVALHAQDRPYVTVWVQRVEEDRVEFYASSLDLLFSARRHGEALSDGTGMLVRVFEYRERFKRFYG